MIQSIPLNKLSASERNVRRASNEEADQQLKADIDARGLLQNLVVTTLAKPRGAFAVVAGGRRFRALQALAAEGRIAKTHEVSCLVVEGEGAEAEEASLAENFQRLAMNPADECLSFQQLLDRGLDMETVARRFGLTVRFVEGRLRLAGLAPQVFEALGAGEISLDVAKAYAATPDRERQAHVFEQAANSYMGNHPDSIRRMMTQATVGANDRRALFVGEEAYVAAGGRIERDLFSGEGEARWLDVALIERLASERMAALAAAAAKERGLAFVRPTLDGWIGYAATEGLRRVTLERVPLTDEESARVDELETGIEELAATLDGEDEEDGGCSEADAKMRELAAAIEAIRDKPPLIPEGLAGRLGTFLLLDDRGQPVLASSYFAECADDECPAGEEDRASEAPGAGSDAPKRPSLSRRLVDELAIQRRDILAVHVAADPALALDLAAFLMADRSAGYCGEKSGSTLSAAHPANPVTGFKSPEAKATVAAQEADDALDRSWSDGATRAERFDAFRALPDEARAAWLAHSIARTLEANANVPGERHCAFHDRLGELLGIEVGRWWRPTGANYFDRTPKAMMLEALRDVGGPALADPYAKAKKAELSQACERIFAGDFIAEAEVKKAALAWVPEAMRFPASAGRGGAGKPSEVMPGDAGEGPDQASEQLVEEIEEAA